MVYLLLNIISIPSLWLSKYLFKKWINPLSVYVIIWYFLISFYHLKLINYNDLSFETWYIIIITYIAYLLGITTYFIANNTNTDKKSRKNIKNSQKLSILFENSQISFYLTLCFGIIGLIGALQAWTVLLKLYGTVTEILLHLGALYQMRVRGDLEGMLPYTSIFSYAGIFFAGINSGIKGKITLISIIPLGALIIKEIAIVGRAGILFGFIEYGLVFLFVILYLNERKIKSKNSKTKLIVTTLLALVLFIGSITFIKNLRGGHKTFTGQTRSIQKMEDSIFITPSIYLYLSAHIGVLNKYLEMNNEEMRFGENTFQFVYNILSKFNIVQKPSGYQKGYYIHVWVNTGTFIRELLVDFGIHGLLIFVFLLGLSITLCWVQFFDNSKLIYFAILIFLFIIVAFSFLMMITRLANWFLSLGLILITLNIIDRFNSYRKEVDK